MESTIMIKQIKGTTVEIHLRESQNRYYIVKDGIAISQTNDLHDAYFQALIASDLLVEK